MLNYLHVKNLALIDEIEVEFGEGLNILSGETGAGKSIIIGSLGLALGDRVETGIIRQGAEYALVELSVSSCDSGVWSILTDKGIEHESDEILIQRRIYPGRSVCRVNGETITLKELSEVSELLIDICGQRESLKLLKNTALKTMLDECSDDEIKILLNKLGDIYRSYKDVSYKIDDTDEDETYRKRKADLAKYELEEIDMANLTVGEDEELEVNYRRMMNSSRINESLNRISNMCDGDSRGAFGILSTALREIRSVSEFDEKLSNLESMLFDMESMASDFSHELIVYMDESEFDEELFVQTEERLNLINRLKDKYGSSIEQILKYRNEKEEELTRLEDHDNYLASLRAEYDRLTVEMDKLCMKIHELRVRAAADLSCQLSESLKEMNFSSADLRVIVNANEGAYSANGYDEVDFMISLNPGEDLRPLSSVASGGELSRIMLALKCVSANRDGIGTMVFDEIDTGISGVTAWKVAERMSELSKDHQVLCITHQPQIAAFADTHFLIEKTVLEGRSITDICKLDRDEMVRELARMSGSDEMSEAALNAANELKNKADTNKIVV